MLCSALMRHGIEHIQRIEMQAAAWLANARLQFLERDQRHYEPEELPRFNRLRALAIRPRSFELHVAVSNAAVSSTDILSATGRIRNGEPVRRPGRFGGLKSFRQARCPQASTAKMAVLLRQTFVCLGHNLIDHRFHVLGAFPDHKLAAGAGPFTHDPLDVRHLS
jgi:hypothetical protein